MLSLALRLRISGETRTLSVGLEVPCLFHLATETCSRKESNLQFAVRSRAVSPLTYGSWGDRRESNPHLQDHNLRYCRGTTATAGMRGIEPRTFRVRAGCSPQGTPTVCRLNYMPMFRRSRACDAAKQLVQAETCSLSASPRGLGTACRRSPNALPFAPCALSWDIGIRTRGLPRIRRTLFQLSYIPAGLQGLEP